MNKGLIEEYMHIVKDAWEKIALAERTIDRRKRDKAIRDAKTEALNMVYPHKARLIEICQMENLGDELFDWGHLTGDLYDVYKKLEELLNN